MTGQVGGQSFSVHAEGERVILRREGGARQEVELVAPDAAAAAGNAQAVSAGVDAARAGAGLPQPLCPHGAPVGSLPEGADEPVASPGVSPLDEAMHPLAPVRPSSESRSPDEPSNRQGGES